MMTKVCYGLQVLLLLILLMNESLLAAQMSSTSSLGRQGEDVDYSANKKMEVEEQFVVERQGNAPEQNIGHREKETSALVVTGQSSPSTNFTKSLSNNLSRKRRALNNCYLPGGQLMVPGRSFLIRNTNTSLQVRANRRFRLQVDVAISWGGDVSLSTSSESLGITKGGDKWSSISIQVTAQGGFLSYYTKLKFTHGNRTVAKNSWGNFWSGQFMSMTVTVWDCIAWYTGDRRHVCEIPHTTPITPITTPTTPRTTTTTPGTTPTTPRTTPTTPRTTTTTPRTTPTASRMNPTTTTLAEREKLSSSLAPVSAEERREGDVPGPSSDDDSHCWLVILPPLALGGVAAAVLVWLRRRRNCTTNAVSLAIEAANQPKVQQESTNPLYESSDVQLHSTLSMPMWNPSRDFPGTTFRSENIYENSSVHG